MPTAREVPDTGTRASDLSDGSKGIPRMPSCTEYSRKDPTPTAKHIKCPVCLGILVLYPKSNRLYSFL